MRAFLRGGSGAGAIVGVHAPGGWGKTELAKHVADEMRNQFEGVLWVDVGEKTAPEVVVEMLRGCGLQTQLGASYELQKTELHHYLSTHSLLVVLDDMRQGALTGLADFLPSKPCAALITSRIQQIGGVTKTFPLKPMAQEQAFALLEAVLGADVVAAETEVAAKLAERCAFNPLALEIAARRIRQLEGMKKPITHYFEIAQGRFSELHMEGDVRWDMKNIFDLSYEDLSADDKKCFRSLAAFQPSGFSPTAAAFLWQVDENVSRAVLSRFINLSLVKIAESGRERYRLHDLLNEYAGSKLHEDKTEEILFRDALAEWIIGLFSSHFIDDQSTAPRVAEERANLLLSCEWARGQKNAGLLARLTTQSRNWFYVSFTEDWIYWIAWLEACLQLGLSDGQLKANVLKAIGDVQQFRKEMDAALASYNAALQLFRAVGDRLGEANVYLSIGSTKRESGDISGARKDFQYALERYKEIGDGYSQARALYRIADCEKDEGNREQALELYKAAYEIWRNIGLLDIANQIIKPRMDEIS
ncbi:MAG: NB-ARC domain-containing protein [Anaerolineales bacterium]